VLLFIFVVVSAAGTTIRRAQLGIRQTIQRGRLQLSSVSLRAVYGRRKRSKSLKNITSFLKTSYSHGYLDNGFRQSHQDQIERRSR
jgi:hypothetical protein